MQFWWATQTKNYPIAIRQGSLWSCPRADGVHPADRIALKDLQLGDYVFHYAGDKHLRAVSRVARTWVDFVRPEGYPRKEDDTDNGWLVQVEPFATDLAIHFTRAAQLVELGHQGPLGTNGRPAQKYLSRLRTADGLALLREAGMSNDDDDGSFGALPAEFWRGAATDMETLVAVRAEQSALRRHLLGDRSTAACDLCGRELPAAILVAAHIVPRRWLTDEERRHLDSIAFLVCTLGCDTLFEEGYLTVDRTAVVRPGRPTAQVALTAAVSDLIGRRCLAHSSDTAEAFARHGELQGVSVID